MTERDTALWGQVWTKINSILSDGAKFQLVYPTISCSNWSQPQPDHINADAYSVVNQMPQWSSIVGRYYPSATGLFSAYTCMLGSCPKLTMPPDLEHQLQNVQVNIERAMRKLQDDEKAKNDAWIQALHTPGTPPPEYYEWLQSSGWKKTLHDDLLVVQEANSVKVQLIGEQNKGYQAAIDACTLPTSPKPGFAKCIFNGIEEWYPNYVISDGQDWIGQLVSGQRGSPLHIHLDSAKVNPPRKTVWASKVGSHLPSFLCTEDGGKISSLVLTGDYDIDINIKAVTVVPVQPGLWYQSKYLSDLAEKDWWNPPFETSGGKSPVFGEGGLLSLKIDSLIVGYGISFQMKYYKPQRSSKHTALKSMSMQESDPVPLSIVTTHEFHIGPFHFDRKQFVVGHSVRPGENNEEVVGFSGASSDIYPVIIGFIVAECINDSY